MLLHEVKDKIQKEAQKIWESNKYRGLIALCTGAGKSKIFINIVNTFIKERWLLVVPTQKLRDENWKDEFKKWNSLKVFNQRVDRCCYASLNKMNLSLYDGVCLDEAHNITENNSKDLSGYKGKILCLTATPPLDEVKTHILYRELNCKVIYNLPLDKGVELGIVSPYKITVIESWLDNTISNIETGNKTKKFKSTERKIYDYKSTVINKIQFSGKPVPKFMYLDRMRFIYNLPSKEKVAKALLDTIPDNERTLIFCGSIKQAENLCKHSWHSKSTSDTLKKFKAKKINRLSSVGMLNEGENIPDVDNIVVVQLNSNERDLIQRLGRGVRLREGHQANIYIIVAVDTQDESWFKKATEALDKSNIYFTSAKNYLKNE
jgi:superfamily II DNA or RNA helicase